VKLVGAKDFDPFGGDGEHPEMTHNAIDADPGTFWMTQTYDGGTLPKPGVGIYVTAAQPVAARRLIVSSTTAGFKANIYGSNGIPTGIAGWGRPLTSFTGSAQSIVNLNPRQQYRSYLIWITKLPPGQGLAKISTIRVLR
jgi:hypothetical protein